MKTIELPSIKCITFSDGSNDVLTDSTDIMASTCRAICIDFEIHFESVSDPSDALLETMRNHIDKLRWSVRPVTPMSTCVVTHVSIEKGSVIIVVTAILGLAATVAINYPALRKNIPIIAKDLRSIGSLIISSALRDSASTPAQDIAPSIEPNAVQNLSLNGTDNEVSIDPEAPAQEHDDEHLSEPEELDPRPNGPTL